MPFGMFLVGLALLFLVNSSRCSPCFFLNTTLYFNGNCYKVFDDIYLNWTEAQTYCSKNILAAKLADPNNAELEFLKKTVSQTSKVLWIDGEQCKQIKINSYATAPCSTKQGFVCQMYVGDPCQTVLPGGEYFNDGNCYKLYDKSVHFDEANATCANVMGRLTEFHLMEVYNYFKSKMNAFFISASRDVDIFLGGSDLLHEGVFTWFSTDTNISIDDWIVNEPNDWVNDTGEDHLCWRKRRDQSIQLNDFNGTKRPGKPFCQKSVLNMSYLIVLPNSGASADKAPKIHITSDNLAVTYLHFTHRLSDGKETENYDWVTSYRDVICNLDNITEMLDTDIYQGVVQLMSTNHVTVVLYQISDRHIGTTLVFPVNLFTSGYFVLTNATIDSGSQIAITALQRDTDVVIKLPRKHMQPFTISDRGFNFQLADKAMVHLDRLDTAYLQSSEDFSGSFVYANKPVVVYSGTKSVETGNQKSDNTLDMAIPVDSLSSEYVTFPSSGLTSDMFRLLAVYDNTEITVDGGALPKVRISQAGYYHDLEARPGSFHHMKSDSYHPFNVIKISLNPNGACITSLLPMSLWRREYVVNISSSEMISLAMENQYNAIFRGQHNASCNNVTGTTYSGCTMTLSPGHHRIGLNVTSFKFVAYSTQSPGSGYCHSLGSSDLIGSQVLFPAERYVDLSDDDPFPAPNHPKTTTPQVPTTSDLDTATTMKQETTTADFGTTTKWMEPTTAEHTAEQTTEKTNETQTKDQDVTTEDHQETSAIHFRTSENTQQTTFKTTDNSTMNFSIAPTTQISEETTEPSSTTSKSTQTQSQTSVPQSLVTASEDTTNLPNNTLQVCTSLCMPRINMSDQLMTAITKKISKTLLVSRRDAFAFMQKKRSMWDDRPSCKAIGISGVVIMICWILFLSSPDMFRLYQFIFLSDNKIKSIP